MKWSKNGFCSVCVNCNFEYDDCEYSSNGWWYCSEEHPSSNLSAFPKMRTPKNCNSFSPCENGEFDSDYWELMHSMNNINRETTELEYSIVSSIIDFNRRMGNYKYGQLFNM